jgi:hypothetical protein
MSRAARLGGALIAGSLLGCGLIAGLKDRELASAQAEGGTSSGAETGTGTADAAFADGAPVNEAPSDAGFCASRRDAMFCDDFDTETLAAKWDSFAFEHDASILHDREGDSPSPPNTLLGIVPDRDAGGGIAFAIRKLAGDFVHIECAFEMLLEQVDPNVRSVTYSGMPVLKIWSYDPKISGYATSRWLSVVMNAEGALMAEQDWDEYGAPDGGAVMPNWYTYPKQGTWVNIAIAIDLDRDGGPPSAIAKLDGNVVSHQSMTLGLKLGPGIELDFGMMYALNTDAAWRIRFDNFVVEAW